MLKIFRRLVFTILLLFFVAVGFFVTNQQRSLAVSNRWACKWLSSAVIDCRKPSSIIQWASGTLQGATDMIAKSSQYKDPLLFVAYKIGITEWGSDKIQDFENNLLSSYSSGDSKCGGLYVCHNYWFRPELSIVNGYPTYCVINDDGTVLIKGDDEGCLHFINLDPLLPWHSNTTAKVASAQPDPGDSPQSPNYWGVGGIENAQNAGIVYNSNLLPNASGANLCSPINPLGCQIKNDGQFNGTTNSQAAIDQYKSTNDAFNERVDAVIALKILKEQCENSKNGAPLPFITCPIYNAVTGAISKLIGGEGVAGERQGLLVDFLTITPLKTSGSDIPVFQQIVGNVVAVANLFYIVVFLILIFSSSLPFGLDNYSVKKTLPKFIGAVIMTQFAYLICGIIIDFFNLLGTIVPNVIFSLRAINPNLNLPTGGGGGAITQGLTGTILVAGASAAGLIAAVGWIMLIILAFIALVAILVAFVYMVLRYLILYILILLSPLAFAAWVLPGTERFFKLWWKNFIRLNAMFPIITGMLAASILLSRVLVGAGTGPGGATSGALALVGMIIPIVALLAVPRTLKWTTDGMSAIAGGILGATAGKIGAGGRAVSNQAQKQAKKGVQYGQGKAVEFGKRQAAQTELASRVAPRFARRQQLKDIDASKSRTNEIIGNQTRGQIRNGGRDAANRLVSSPNSSRAIGEARAHIDQMVQSGDGVGLAHALSGFTQTARAAGWDDQRISEYWNNQILTGANMGTAKALSPALTPSMNPADRDTSGRHPSLDYVSTSGEGESVAVSMGGGDYSSVGRAKLPDLDKDILSSHVSNGQSAADLNFDQTEVEAALSNPNTTWKSPETRSHLETLRENAYASGRWVRPASPSGGGGNTPTPPPSPSSGNTTTGSPGNPTVNFGP